MTDSPPVPILAADVEATDGPPSTAMAILEAIALLDHRLGELILEAKPLRERMGVLDKEKARITARKAELSMTLEEMRKGVFVSDHAVVRYLERRYGFDFDGVRREIATPALRAAAAVGAVGVKVAGGSFKLKGRTVTTYIAHEDKP